MDPKGMQALAESAAAYGRRTDQLRMSDEEMAGQLGLDLEEPRDRRLVGQLQAEAKIRQAELAI